MAELWKNFFTNKAYLPADLPGKLFSPLHIVVMVILIIAVPLAAFLLRKTEEKKLKILFIVLWAVLSAFEIVKIVWESATNPNGFEVTGILPLYLCSIFMYVMPFAIWQSRASWLRRSACGFLCTLNLIGGLVNFIYPVNVLSNYSVISFAGLHTLIYHAVMVFVALLMLFSGYYRFRLRDCALAFLPVLVVSIPANIVNLVYHCDYMFFGGGFFPFSLIGRSSAGLAVGDRPLRRLFRGSLAVLLPPGASDRKEKRAQGAGCLKAKAFGIVFLRKGTEKFPKEIDGTFVSCYNKIGTRGGFDRECRLFLGVINEIVAGIVSDRKRPFQLSRHRPREGGESAQRTVPGGALSDLSVRIAGAYRQRTRNGPRLKERIGRSGGDRLRRNAAFAAASEHDGGDRPVGRKRDRPPHNMFGRRGQGGVRGGDRFGYARGLFAGYV